VNQYFETATVCSMDHKILKETCKGCLHIRNIWYKYIDDTGFIDIERASPNSSNSIAKLLSLNAFKSEDTYNNKLSYYVWAKQSLNLGKFKSQKDKTIWEYHADGFSTRQIEKQLGISQSWIVRKIQNIKSYIASNNTSM